MACFGLEMGCVLASRLIKNAKSQHHKTIRKNVTPTMNRGGIGQFVLATICAGGGRLPC